MNLTDEEAIFCLSKAKEITEQYNLYALHPRDLRSIDDLEWICIEYLNKQVEIYDLPIEAADRVVRGLFVATQSGTYLIFRIAELGDRERRFVTCKELFHAILDSEDCRNMDLVSHLEESQTSFSIEDSNPNSAVKMEMLAEIAAMEFLFPYKCRVEELANGIGNGDFFADIARKYGVPQIYVEAYLSDTYMAEIAKIEW